MSEGERENRVQKRYLQITHSVVLQLRCDVSLNIAMISHSRFIRRRWDAHTIASVFSI